MPDNLYEDKTVGAFSGLQRNNFDRSAGGSQNTQGPPTMSMFDGFGNAGNADRQNQPESNSEYENDGKTVGLFSSIPANRMPGNAAPVSRPYNEQPKPANVYNGQQMKMDNYVEQPKPSSNYSEQQKLLNSFNKPIQNSVPVQKPEKSIKPVLIAGIVILSLILIACIAVVVMILV